MLMADGRWQQIGLFFGVPAAADVCLSRTELVELTSGEITAEQQSNISLSASHHTVIPAF